MRVRRQIPGQTGHATPPVPVGASYPACLRPGWHPPDL